MATPKQEINLSRYLDVDGVRIDSRRLDVALEHALPALKEEVMDALDHIRKGFFKALYANTGLKDKRFIATKNVGIGRHIKVYRNPRAGSGPLDMVLGIFTRSKITALHEKGGTVRAKSGMMAIPLDSARSSGRLSKSVSEFQGMRRVFDPQSAKARALKLFMAKRGSNTFLFRKQDNGEIDALFILKNQMTIQPRLRLQDTWDRLEGYRINVFNDSVGKALSKTGLI